MLCSPRHLAPRQLLGLRHSRRLGDATCSLLHSVACYRVSPLPHLSYPTRIHSCPLFPSSAEVTFAHGSHWSQTRRSVFNEAARYHDFTIRSLCFPSERRRSKQEAKRQDREGATDGVASYLKLAWPARSSVADGVFISVT